MLVSLQVLPLVVATTSGSTCKDTSIQSVDIFQAYFDTTSLSGSPDVTYNGITYSTSTQVIENLTTINGCDSVRVTNIIVSSLDADFSADATTVCQGFAVNFTDASTGSAGITSWSWDFGDGTTSTDQNPTHTYNTVGTYDVSLTVNGSADTETKTGYITVTQIGSIYADDFETQGSWSGDFGNTNGFWNCLLYTSPSPRDGLLSRMPSSA